MADTFKYKDSPLKMLLTAPSNSGHLNLTSIQQYHTSTGYQKVTSLSTGDATTEDVQIKPITFYNHFSTTAEKELDPILMDHCYSRPWNWRPETSYIRPTKTLFIAKGHSKANPTLTLQKSIEEKDIVDVECVSPPPALFYDMDKAKTALQECEKYAYLARPETADDWEEYVSKINWTQAQIRLFSSMVKILNSDRNARLTYVGSWNEPILRRAVIDKSVRRVRTLMASTSWDPKLTQWLHSILMDYLSAPFLAAYFEMLQCLKMKLPQFVEKMIFGPNAINRLGLLSNENIFPLLKKPWDPVSSGLVLEKPRKLPGNPIFIVASSFTSATGTQSKYLHKWIKLLNTLAHVITVHGQTCMRMNMTNCADHLFNATRLKLQEVRNDCPGRPIILVGFNTGSAIVCQVAEVEHAVAVVCLGFPLLTAEGKRGEADDYLLELMYPVLFVIGQNSHRTSREEMEDMRERMKIETGLIVVGSADDYLRISKSKRRSEGITQSIVDRCILDEIGEFVGSILLSPYPPVSRPVYTAEQLSNKHLKNRIRSNSNCSSLESEPPSPQPKVHTRPVGRPPGSGKKKLTNFHGTSPPSPNISTPNTPIPQPPSPEINPETPAGLTTYLTKPEVFRASNTPEALSRAVQSITPTTIMNTPTVPPTMGILTNRPIVNSGSSLSTLLQSGIRPNHPPITRPNNPILNINSGVKILENITVNSSLSQKLLSNSRPVTLYNTVGGNRTTNIGNVVLLPDGAKYIRNATTLPPIRTVGGISTMLPALNRNQGHQIIKHQSNQGIAKLVPTRRQIITKSRPMQEPSLPPPTNLTTADIMDLPIIFADDSLVSEAPMPPVEEPKAPQQVVITTKSKPISTNKLVVINKQIPTTSTTLTMPSSSHPNLLKRPVPTNAQRPSTQPMKYAKIIVSKRGIEDVKPQRSPKPYDPNAFEHLDLEAELKATTVPKPSHATMLSKSKADITKQLIVGNKKATITSGGSMGNMTVRVPVSFSKSSTAGAPSRFVYTESPVNDSATHVVLNRTVTSNKDNSKTIRFENVATKDVKVDKTND